MKLKLQEITVDQQALTPTLIIDVEIEFDKDIEAPISISGRLLSIDSKVLSLLNENQHKSDSKIELRILNKEEKDQIIRENSHNFYTAQFSAILSPKAIDYIETHRCKDKEKSVRLWMDFVVKYIDLPATLKNMSTDFLRVNIKKDSLSTVINQSDWINKFSSLLGIGNFLLFELNIPDQHDVTDEWKGLYDRLSLRLKEMNEAITEGDWHKTMSKGRQFYENLKIGDKKDGHKKFELELKKLFERDQHSTEGIQNLLDGIWKFFEYNSKFVHDKDKVGNLNPIPITTKEDAYFVYTLAIGLLNIIGKKISDEEKYT